MTADADPALTADEQEVLNGEAGGGAALAMRLVVDLAQC